ncbi:hypothetical protein MNNICLKF_00065 [Synechococcus sp. CBW1107]|nr:hypothetical protein MNNICLKF_00065 [Synechococcus sp. CBW1107]
MLELGWSVLLREGLWLSDSISLLLEPVFVCCDYLVCEVISLICASQKCWLITSLSSVWIGLCAGGMIVVSVLRKLS